MTIFAPSPGKSAGRPRRVRIHSAVAAKRGSAKSMRSMISVIASAPYRYPNLTMIALPENAIDPSAARAIPSIDNGLPRRDLEPEEVTELVGPSGADSDWVSAANESALYRKTV